MGIQRFDADAGNVIAIHDFQRRIEAAPMPGNTESAKVIKSFTYYDYQAKGDIAVPLGDYVVETFPGLPGTLGGPPPVFYWLIGERGRFGPFITSRWQQYFADGLIVRQ